MKAGRAVGRLPRRRQVRPYDPASQLLYKRLFIRLWEPLALTPRCERRRRICQTTSSGWGGGSLPEQHANASEEPVVTRW